MTRYGPYLTCGMRVVSEMELPELMPADGSNLMGESPDVRVVLRPCGRRSGQAFSVLDDGTVQMNGGATVMEVDAAAREVALQIAPDSNLLMVRSFLYGFGLPTLLFRRGLMPLHGSCVRMGDAAIVLSGDRGAGKSTMATALMQAGCPLVSDDLCPIDLQGGQPVVLPAFPRIKLLGDSALHFQLEVADDRAPAECGGKAHFRFQAEAAAASEPLPLRAIISLAISETGEVTLEPLSTVEAIRFLRSQVHRDFIGGALGCTPRIFQQICGLISTARVYRLSRPRDLSRLSESVQALFNLME